MRHPWHYPVTCRLRRPDVRHYALAYARHLLGGPEPEVPKTIPTRHAETICYNLKTLYVHLEPITGLPRKP